MEMIRRFWRWLRLLWDPTLKRKVYRDFCSFFVALSELAKRKREMREATGTIDHLQLRRKRYWAE